MENQIYTINHVIERVDEIEEHDEQVSMFVEYQNVEYIFGWVDSVSIALLHKNYGEHLNKDGQVANKSIVYVSCNDSETNSVYAQICTKPLIEVTPINY